MTGGPRETTHLKTQARILLLEASETLRGYLFPSCHATNRLVLISLTYLRIWQ